MKKNKDYLIVIPARFNSSRFPGKLLKKINGKSILNHVWEICVKASSQENVIVATDHEKIINHCKTKGMRYLMTSSSCLTGTDRLYEVSKKISSKIYINVQGDEPLLSHLELKKFIKFSLDNSSQVTNAMTKISRRSDFLNLNIPKVVTNEENYLLYISRSPIPTTKKGEFKSSNKQVCIYSIPKKAIKDFGERRKKSRLEQIEDIEILRFLEMGYKVKMYEVSKESFSIDTPSDLRKVRRIITERQKEKK